jgi:hypothetical protein
MTYSYLPRFVPLQVYTRYVNKHRDSRRFEVCYPKDRVNTLQKIDERIEQTEGETTTGGIF